ncbi:hypothetical protein C1645_865191 [Glomus cerebriforme]|uniref:Uncharacterized protein n=1 Tax=Glomus cerebriforme TaxID=658196 RepID=A0A397S4B6_9GLOM|nr:hypothetical protein C1645_865191 [Glomus cerebriforme]
MQQAIRIAYGEPRWRVGTLNDELIDAFGRIIGGGPKARDIMNSIFSFDMTLKIVRNLEQEPNHLEKQWKEFEDELKSLQSQLQEKKGEVLKIRAENDITKFESNITNNVIRLSNLQKKFSRKLQLFVLFMTGLMNGIKN